MHRMDLRVQYLLLTLIACCFLHFGYPLLSILIYWLVAQLHIANSYERSHWFRIFCTYNYSHELYFTKGWILLIL